MLRELSYNGGMQSYRHIGELLVRAREEYRLSISEISAALHIRPRYLVALEEGDLASLPGLSYARGYLTRYAAYLSLDRVEVLRRFDLVTQERALPHYFLPHSFSREKRVPPHILRQCLLLAALVFLLWALWLRPDHRLMSMVDPLPEPMMERPTVRLSAESIEKLSCLQPQKTLYPPCYWPIKTPEPSVMRVITP